MATKLTPQTQFLIVAALCLLALLAFFLYYYKPRQETLTTMRDDLAAKQATAAQYRAAVATIPDLKVKVAQLEQDRAEFVRALPTTQQFGQIVAQLRANASASKSEITNLSFANGQATNLPAGVRPININLNVKGQYGQIFQLMRRLETQNRFTTVNTLDLQLPKADSFNPDLAGTLAMTVYTFDPNLATLPAGATAGTPANAAAPAAAPAAPAAPGGIR